MKKIFILTLLFLAIGIGQTKAQYIRGRLGFPGGVYLTAPGPAPFYGGIWIGPEWQWRGGRYEYLHGYWARPRYHGAIWAPGYWRYSRHGYRWMPGCWR